MRTALCLALLVAAACSDQLPTDPTGLPIAGSIAADTEALVVNTYHTVNSNNGGYFQRANYQTNVQSAVRCFVMAKESSTYTCSYGGLAGIQTFCKRVTGNQLSFFTQGVSGQTVVSIYSTAGTSWANASATQIFQGNTDWTGVSGHSFHHIFDSGAAPVGSTADCDVLNPNMLPNMTTETVRVP